ncbi:MAG TPA: amino acid adenylation domain-containing protein, partial [Herpetosiphonaceae bacterium]
LAVLTAGGCYVPLDPAYPTERLAFMLDDAQVAVVLTQRAVRDHVPTTTPVACLDTLALAAYPATPPPARIHPDQLAYVIYTSGSTGRPKGVMVAHRGLSNLVFSQIREATTQADSRMLQFASISFDAAIFEICAALAAGASLYLASQADLLPGPTLHAYLQTHAITTVVLPPSALAVTSAADLPALQTVVAAGEACSAPVVASWSANRRFINGYGPTEATVCTTYAECQPDGRTPPIGRPIANMAVYVLDVQMQPVPVGVPGELYIGGVQLARGYLGRPDLTAARFVPDPFSGTPGARLYRTGDLARWRSDGQLEYLGRVDQQVKLRGYRIELGEIESVLLEHPAVQAAAVDLRETRASHEQLVAYVVERGAGDDGLIADLRSYAAERLPAYMVPSAFVVLDALPLTPNGKVDRKALPQPERTSAPTTLVAPRTETETTLARIWADVLGL